MVAIEAGILNSNCNRNGNSNNKNENNDMMSHCSMITVNILAIV